MLINQPVTMKLPPLGATKYVAVVNTTWMIMRDKRRNAVD